MDTALMAALRQQLLAQRAALLNQIATLRGGSIARTEAASGVFGPPQDPSSQVATEREREFALDEHDSAEINVIEAALKRMGAGVYGLCTDCGAAIPAARLQAAPEAPRCIACQQRYEHSHAAST
ncbi:MAG: TraR/DksA family transcriptional regulator [Burkholderiaceae bacterium]